MSSNVIPKENECRQCEEMLKFYKKTHGNCTEIQRQEGGPYSVKQRLSRMFSILTKNGLLEDPYGRCEENGGHKESYA